MLPDFLLIDKPAGPTSFDVVRQVKRHFAEKRVGHLGTLDPFATGLLVIALGPITRLLPLLSGLPKSYRAIAILGATSTTGDPEGELVQTGRPLPGRAEIDQLLPRFRGELQQTPPAFSAAKIAGERAYDIARRGETVELAPRAVTVHELQVLRFDPPELEFTATVSTGTYIRALASDLGEALGCGAYLCTLRRTAIGHMAVDSAKDLEHLDEAGINAAALLEGVLPFYHLLPADLPELRHGRAWTVPGALDGKVALFWKERVVGIGTVEQGWLRPSAVLLDRLLG